MDEPIRVTSLDCWHANELIYQADGRTDDGKYVYVHYRGGRFSVWVGDRLIEDITIPIPGDWVIDGRPIDPPVSPSTITRATLAAWTHGVIAWPERIDGYSNEPGDR